MNKTLDTELANLVSKTTQGMDSSIIFAQKELPTVIEQLITWNIYAYSIKIVICIFTFFLLFMWAKKIRKYMITFELDALEFLLFLVVLVLTSLFFIGSLFDLIQIIVAPKIWLIEYASILIKCVG